ncbi:hypothetical protein ADL28_42215 [Streptomyces violaceusniger]|uniref:Uncharacterized protein n=1 Tax=Streptomyces violaceusniger TaxID=68280 RepID=A0A0X3VG35_STRVO|nr:hypothetical protein ADL28_42215 [Streptomyces violaceusniger]
MGLEDFPDSGGGEPDFQGGELAVDSPVAPVGVLPGQAEDEGLDAADGGRSARPFRAGNLGVATAEQIAVQHD